MPDQSPESVALKLLELVADAEGKPLRLGKGMQSPSREWIFDTYEECLRVVRGERKK